MADIHGDPAQAPQMPAAAGPGPAPAPYQGPDLTGAPPYEVALPAEDPGALVMAGESGPGVTGSGYAHDVKPYAAGEPDPVFTGGGDDAGGRDDVAATVAGAVAAAQARYGELQSDTYGQGSAIGDLMTLPPNPLDPGVGSLGVTDPAGAYFDPPRNYGG